jgi:hypothetical protein
MVIVLIVIGIVATIALTHSQRRPIAGFVTDPFESFGINEGLPQ